MNVRYRKIDAEAITPTRGSEKAAGLDLYASQDAYIEPGKTVKIGTGIAIEIPDGYFGGIYARSGLATKKGLRPSNCVGVIDSDYRGEVVVALYNDSEYLREIESGERVAQLIIQPYENVSLIEIDTLSETDRGSGGFGSSGEK